MCVILVCPPKVRPAAATLYACHAANPHGAGVAWRENGKIRWQKNLGPGKLMMKLRELPPGEVVIHFRWASVGGVDARLCHPFPVTPKAPISLSTARKCGLGRMKTTLMKGAPTKLVLFFCGVMLGFIRPATAAPGDLDPTFGDAGKVLFHTRAPGGSFSAAVQSDGKILVAGSSFTQGAGNYRDFVLVRFNTDGSLDTTFSNDGVLTTSIGNEDNGRSVAIQSGGKILVTGGSNSDFALVRYNTDGSLDTTFNGSGKVTTNINTDGYGGSNDDFGQSVVVQSDGKILVAGSSSSSYFPGFALVRYDGTLLTLLTLLTISGSQSVYLGSAATFSVAVEGIIPLTYQWQKDGVDIPGATGSSYSIASAQPWHIGDYKVKVTDASGTITSSTATLSLAGINSGLWRGLVGYYEFDSNANDSSVFGRNGSNSGATSVSDRSNNPHHAFYFDGSAFVTVESSPVTGNTPFTVSLWARVDPQPVGTEGWLLAFGQPQANQAFHLGNRGYGATNLYGAFWANSTLSNTPLVDFEYNQFFHFTATFDGSQVKVFKDGVFVGSSTQDLSDVNIQPGLLLFGKQLEYSEFFKGSLDSVRIYNRALSDEEVTALYNSEEPDSDHDGIRDRFETGTGIFLSSTDTGTSPTNPDSDGDGLTDGQEVNTHLTNPNIADTDGDGFNDGFEVSTGFSPTSDLSTPDTLSSIFTAVEYRFNAALGVSYRIEVSTDLATWTTLETPITGTGGVITRFYSVGGQPRQFYRSRRN